jgi:RNase P subunit RPR2
VTLPRWHARKPTRNGLKIDNKQGEGVATISLCFDKEVPDDLKAIFIEYVHRHLAKFGCEVSRDRRTVCPKCGKPVKDLDAVRKRFEPRKDFIYCQACDEKVPLIDFIEQRLKSDPVARKILAMDESATRELDTQALEQIVIATK